MAARIPNGKPLSIKRVVQRGHAAHKVTWPAGQVLYIQDEKLLRELAARGEPPAPQPAVKFCRSCQLPLTPNSGGLCESCRVELTATREQCPECAGIGTADYGDAGRDACEHCEGTGQL